MTSATRFPLVVLLLLLLAVLDLCQGHGRLRCPPGRSVLWRENLAGAPKNYQDNELNCGGRWTHWDLNHGKCGVCGDPYGVPVEENQPPNGKYAKPSILTECYDSKTTEYIPSYVQITAPHLGYIEYRLCPNNDWNKPVTQECLDKYVLDIRDERGRNHGKRFKVRESQYHLKVKIPEGVTCEQCVLQWRYIAGNNWGCDRIGPSRRRCGIGFGAQESFFNCADIAILPDCGKVKVARLPSSSVCRSDKMAKVTTKPANQTAETGKGTTINRSESRNKQDDEKMDDDNKTPSSTSRKEKEEEEKKKKTTGPEDDGVDKDVDKMKSDEKTETTPPPEKNTDTDSSDSKKRETPKKTTHSDSSDSKKAQTPSPKPKLEKKPVKKLCSPAGIWMFIRSMYFWCRVNCGEGHCPPSMCICL